MTETEWIEIGQVVGDTGAKGDKGDTGIGTTIKGSYNSYSDLVNAHPRSTGEDAYIIDGEIYYWNVNDNKWESGGSIKGPKGDTGSQGVKGDTGASGSKGESGEKGDTGATGSKGEKGDTGAVGPKGDTGATGDVGPQGPKGDTGSKGDVGAKGEKGDTGKAFTYDDFTPEQLASLKGDTGATGPQGEKGDTGNTGATGDVGPQGPKGDTGSKGEKGDTGASGSKGEKGDTGSKGEKGDTGATGGVGPQGVKGDTGETGPKGEKGDTGVGSDEKAGWKLPVDEILTTTTLPTGVSKGYRVAICTSSEMSIKEYNGSSWDSESLDAYSVIPLKHSGSIQMYIAKASGPVYMGVDYGIFGKFRFMTQADYDGLASYDEDTIYFVRSA